MTKAPPQGDGIGPIISTSISLLIKRVAINTTLDNTYFTVEVDASGGNRIITLPTAASAFQAASNTGRLYNIVKIDASANTVTIQANGAELINGSNTIVINNQYVDYSIQSNGTNWDILPQFFQNLQPSARPTFIGLNVLDSTVLNNVFVGTGAGASIMTGTENTFVGFQAGQNDQFGTQNTFVGFQAGQNNDNGSNTYIGFQAGQLGSADVNICIGHQAGQGNSGTGNIFIGNVAGQINTVVENIFIGHSAGLVNTIGTPNIFIGINAGSANISGSNNTVIGYQAGQLNTTSYDNVIIGHQAGYNHPNDGNFNANVIIGFQARYINSTVNNDRENVIIGYQAGYSDSYGNAKTFIGYRAGYSGGDSYNTYVGHSAGYSQTGGYYNTYIGREAGYSNVDGASNTFIGRGAGHLNVNGMYNTFIGKQAGYKNTGDGSIAIGKEAGYNDTNSNKLYIANSSVATPLIGGDFSLGTPANVGFAGIGTATPNSTFQIVGSFAVPVTPTAVDLALDDTHYTIAATGGALGITITLPTAVGITGRTYKIVKVDAGLGVITVATTGGELINDATPKTVAVRYTAVLVQSDGTNWMGNLLALI